MEFYRLSFVNFGASVHNNELIFAQLKLESLRCWVLSEFSSYGSDSSTS